MKDTLNKIRGKVGQQVDLVGAMLTVGIAGVIGYVLLFAMQSTEDAAGLADQQNATFGDASANITSGVVDAFGLAPVVFIIIFLVVAIGYLTMLRRRN